MCLTSLGIWGIFMKKIYEKPTLTKREQLSRVVAFVVSGKF